MTPTQQLVELRLGGDLAGYIARARTEPNRQSWRTIAADLTQRTRIPVSYEAVRVWSQQLCERAA